jgi:hypothetical protein
VAGTADTKDKNFGLNAVSKAIVHEASRLENDAAGWDRKMQELERDLNTSQQDDEATAKDVDESLLVLQAAAGRLGPDAEARVTLRKRRVPFGSSRAVRRCIHLQRFARLPVISNRRPLNCSL